MKSRQFTLGLMALILTQLLSFKTLAQCCEAPVNLRVWRIFVWAPVGLPPHPWAQLEWQHAQKAGCDTPVKYRIELTDVGASFWVWSNVTTKTSFLFPMAWNAAYEWRVRSICSDTNRTAWVYGPDFYKNSLTSPPGQPSGTTSSASATSLQDKLTVAAYPNPVVSEVKLSGNLKAGGPVSVQIINSVGQTVLRKDYNFNPGNFNTGIDVSKLPPGVYLVVVNDKAERATLNILKQ
jgi:hypothetical protein